MTSGKNYSITGLLMALSLILLIVLQILWLTGSWREARENFRKETNNLFRNTVFALQDSITLENIQPMGLGDSIRSGKFFLGDSLHSFPGSDTVRIRKGSVVEVFITQENRDSVAQFMVPLARRLRMDKRNRKFILHLGPDSLSNERISKAYTKALTEADISVPFKVHRIRKTTPGRIPRSEIPVGALVSEVVPFNPVNYYFVEFTASDRVFVEAIMPQFLFCLFVTLLTAGAFYSMNRNMRIQRRLMEMKNDFISNMSHELKTPVSTVSVAIEALERFKGLNDPDKANEYLAMAKSELQRLTLMTDRILQTAASGIQNDQSEKTHVDLDEKIRQVISSLKLLFEKRGIRPMYEKYGSDFNLFGNPEHLVTLIYNLLDNAIKYTRQSGKISLVLKDLGKDIELAVLDNGRGIPAEYHARVFEKFFRVPSGDVHDIRGYGLGLSYVAVVVENHAGNIQLESEPDKGTCVTIRLPKNLEK